MKKIMWLGIAVGLLAGCQSPVDDMLNNKFIEIQEQAPPSELKGYWTGSIGPYLMTIKVGADGYGVDCYSYLSEPIIGKLKYNNNFIYQQSGTKMKVKFISDNKLVTTAEYYGTTDHVFYKDDDLKKADFLCKKALSE
jgi:hypothetical protein